MGTDLSNVLGVVTRVEDRILPTLTKKKRTRIDGTIRPQCPATMRANIIDQYDPATRKITKVLRKIREENNPVSKKITGLMSELIGAYKEPFCLTFMPEGKGVKAMLLKGKKYEEVLKNFKAPEITTKSVKDIMTKAIKFIK